MSEEGTYAFTILPPWYRTNLAYTLYGLALAFGIVAARRGLVLHEREKARRWLVERYEGLLDRTALYQPYQPNLEDPRLPAVIRAFNG